MAERSNIDHRAAQRPRIAGKLGDRPAAGRSDGNAGHPSPSFARDFLGFSDQRLALYDLVEEDDRCLGSYAGMIGTVADVRKGGIGKSENHAAMGDSMAVEHVGAD